MNAAPVRDRLIHALRLDLVGPDPLDPRDAPLASEVLEVPPTHWYLTGFLVPSGVVAELFEDPTATEEVTSGASGSEEGEDDDGPARRPVFPSSLGVTVLVPAEATTLHITARWATYTPEAAAPKSATAATEPIERGGLPTLRWTREPYEAEVSLALDAATMRKGATLPGSGGVLVRGVMRPLREDERAQVPPKTCVVTIFLVNQRPPVEAGPDQDRAVIFQAELAVHCSEGFVPRPNRRGAHLEDDLDERMGDLQYRDAFEYAVGHGVSVRSTVQGSGPDVFCDTVRTTWTPSAQVERVIPSEVPGCELRMDALAAMDSPATLRAEVAPMVRRYRDWIAQQAQTVLDTPARGDLSRFLLEEASRACDRIEAGLAHTEDPQVFDAFRRANRAMADAARQRSPHRYLAKEQGGEGKVPTWRPFQLAFVLMNVAAQAEPTHAERDVVDLIFFPTGGGKTEAYLGLAAFTLVLRRLRNPGVGSAGVAVLMRYTLRLLTLDQLGRAATLVCALELQRRENETLLGPQRFSIGLWVGKAVTPLRFGTDKDHDDSTARERVLAYNRNPDGAPSPLPLDKCPWCREPFGQDTFHLAPSIAAPRQMRVRCHAPSCDFRWSRQWPEGLPIVTVDEEVYRELPCFLIATVDKFAALPWVGRTGLLLGRNATHRLPDGFSGPADPPDGATPLATPLLPPDLIIQDELHLISGPLGTMVGLYETALDALSTRTVNGKVVRPKIVASTATVRNAQAQVRALFARSDVRVFPPPGPNRSTSFFAETLPLKQTKLGHPRTYVGISAPGRSMKVLLLRSYVALLGAAQRAYEEDPASSDPYMTLVGYFNSLRELGGARRIVEDEVRSKVGRADRRRRAAGRSGDEELAARVIAFDCVELTSRESTEMIKIAKERLEVGFDAKASAPVKPAAPAKGAKARKQRPPVDVALASNMISVGLDIERLGLMVVCGQPKTAAEYIQASSRVGRAPDRPGLVVTLLNAHRPRDRSHLEHFEAFHQAFYRAVEATSVTPFSPRAIDRGLPAVAVALARLSEPGLTAPDGAAALASVKARVTEYVADTLVRRAEAHRKGAPADESLEELSQGLRARVATLFDAWAHVIDDDPGSKGLAYQKYEDPGGGRPLLHMPLDEDLAEANRYERRFVASRSMRDVEASTDLMVMTRKGAGAVVADEEEGR
ncbi:MAG: helicase [Myxococcaceae bacterium]|nr:MAG: helicase [Myxococcaceae bacterium]